VARLLEVSDQSLYAWRREEQIDHGELPELSSAEREELHAAGLRIRALETEQASESYPSSSRQLPPNVGGE
jgi:transposase